MGEVTKYSNGKSSSDQEHTDVIVPKPEHLDSELLGETDFLRQLGSNVASSSGSNVRSVLLGMGFLSSLVDKAIEEKGEEDIELLLETLLKYSAQQKSNSELSDSLNALLDDGENGRDSYDVSKKPQVKEEPDINDGINDDKRTSLLMMNFSVNEVEFAMNNLGKDAQIAELVDFIVAAQMAAKFEREEDAITYGDQDKDKETNNERLYGTMEKTLQLLEMGFSENQVSEVIERLGSEVPVSELADSIFADQIANFTGSKCADLLTDGRPFTNGEDAGIRFNNIAGVKTEYFSPDIVSDSRHVNRDENCRGKRPQQEYGVECSNSVSEVKQFDREEVRMGKRPKQEYIGDSSSSPGFTWVEEKVDPNVTSFGVPSSQSTRQNLDQIVAKRPFFFYGNVANISQDCWDKISQFLYDLQPEFVNTQFFSALSRKEGYIHNLPTENRFHIVPKPPMTIRDAIPHTKKWWPSWDTRDHLSCISFEASRISQLCDRLGRILIDSRGMLPPERQRDILHQCHTKNLVWVDQYKLAPIEPEYLECILGYPLNHTEASENSYIERVKSLKYCFQTDTLGYHLSALKSFFPEGITMLSVFSGIGGAEISLHRLGIHLKAVVSIETSGTKRKILRRWWKSTGQVGELIQIEDIQRMTSTKLENLIEKFGGFDLVICQNPCSQSSTCNISTDSESVTGLDFPLFSEFVRVLQRVRSAMERKR